MSTTLKDLVNDGKLVQDYGSVVAIHTGKSKKHAIAWAMKHLGARLPEGVDLSEDTGFIFVGKPGSLPVKVVSGVHPASTCHFALRAIDKDDFKAALSILESRGFADDASAYSDHDTERWFAVLTNRDLGFTVHLSWRRSPPEDLLVEAPLPTKPRVPLREAVLRADMRGELDEPDEASDRSAEAPSS